jgi:hypothetical protein
MLLVLDPLAQVAMAVLTHVETISLSHIVEPATLVYISIRVNESTLAISSVFSPRAYVLCAVLPLLNPSALSFLIFGQKSKENRIISHCYRPFQNMFLQQVLINELS